MFGNKNRRQSEQGQFGRVADLGFDEPDYDESEFQARDDTVYGQGYVEDPFDVPPEQPEHVVDTPAEEVSNPDSTSTVQFVPNGERQNSWERLRASKIIVSIFKNHASDTDLRQQEPSAALVLRQLELYGFSRELYSEEMPNNQNIKDLVQQITDNFSKMSKDNSYIPEIGAGVGCYDRVTGIGKVIIPLKTRGMPRAFSDWHDGDFDTVDMPIREEDFCRIFKMTQWQNGIFREIPPEIPPEKTIPVQPESPQRQAAAHEDTEGHRLDTMDDGAPRQLDFGGAPRSTGSVSERVAIRGIDAISAIVANSAGPSSPSSSEPIPPIEKTAMPTLGRPSEAGGSQQERRPSTASQQQQSTSSHPVTRRNERNGRDESTKKTIPRDQASRDIPESLLSGSRGVIDRFGSMTRKHRTIGIAAIAIAVPGAFGVKGILFNSDGIDSATSKSLSSQQAEDSIATNLKSGEAYAWSDGKVCFDDVAKIATDGVVQLRVAQRDSQKKPAWIGDGRQSLDLNKASLGLNVCALGREAIKFDRSKGTTTATIDLSKFRLSTDALKGSKAKDTPIDIKSEKHKAKVNISKAKKMIKQEEKTKSASKKEIAHDKKMLNDYVPTYNETGKGKQYAFTLDQLKSYNTKASSKAFKKDSQFLATTAVLARAQKDTTGLKTAIARPYKKLIRSSAKEGDAKAINIKVQNEPPLLVDQFLDDAKQSVKTPAGKTIELDTAHHEGKVQAVVGQVKTKIVPQEGHPHSDNATAIKNKAGK